MFYNRLSRLKLVSGPELESAETWESPPSSLTWLQLISAQLLASAGSEPEPRQHYFSGTSSRNERSRERVTSGNVHVPGLPGNRSNQVIQINQVARNTTWSHEVSVLIPGQIQTGQSSFQVASRGMLELSDCGSVNGAHL
ncbi:hypothetical protein K443DRAFT_429 [Laccaria amethystina LaAM-08-1]|uniref:Uncharacterized protein n=1 Tax=Laccaria amethystina LaAM-08-1 TaxID=1095629 RepID=A0A0C9XC39_9AGAR|nr:hypothetical protein K443DRAFT_429 [Laccaria amethystina LaAM-08-1]